MVHLLNDARGLQGVHGVQDLPLPNATVRLCDEPAYRDLYWGVGVVLWVISPGC